MADTTAGPPRSAPRSGILRSRFVRHFRQRPLTITATGVLVLMLLSALFAPLLAPQNPYDLETLQLGNSFVPPIWMEGGEAPYLLGTDVQGRDVLSTILYGSRTSFLVGFSVIVLAGVLGGSIGLLAGFYGGWVDAITMRLADTLLAFSTTLIALLLLGLFQESSVFLVVVAIVIAGWVQYARTMRGSVLAVKEEDYVIAGRAIGGRDLQVIFRHVLPNAIPPLFVIAAVDFGVAVILEATLSFLGVGVPVTEPSLGVMISEGKNYMYAGMWWLVLFPSLALMAIVFSINLIADWLRDEIDPRS